MTWTRMCGMKYGSKSLETWYVKLIKLRAIPKIPKIPRNSSWLRLMQSTATAHKAYTSEVTSTRPRECPWQSVTQNRGYFKYRQKKETQFRQSYSTSLRFSLSLRWEWNDAPINHFMVWTWCEKLICVMHPPSGSFVYLQTPGLRCFVWGDWVWSEWIT